jgi:hypothetical protein
MVVNFQMGRFAPRAQSAGTTVDVVHEIAIRRLIWRLQSPDPGIEFRHDVLQQIPPGLQLHRCAWKTPAF